MAAKSKSARRKTNSGQFQAGRRPHNAKPLDFENVADLVRKLGSESKRVSLNGREVDMTWAERSLRLTIERAINGNVRDITQLLRLMIEHPNISGHGRLRCIIYLGGLAGV
jgi:hypothetical protein